MARTLLRTPPDLLADLDVPHDRGVPLGPMTWYGVGGPAAILARPSTVEQLQASVQRCRERDVPVYVLGSGANLLVRDEGVDGVVIKLDAPAFAEVQVEGPRVTAGGGFDLMKLVLQTARAGLGGLEALAGIPASVGGAVHMNAGGAFGDIGSRVAAVRTMDQAGAIHTLERDALHFGYRHSSIEQPLILDAVFNLELADAPDLMRRVKEIFFYKKNSQPMGERSAGCAFKNPAPDTPAGRLIDEAGLKGYAVGHAHVSTVHANFVVAHKTATRADDLLAVIEHVQHEVHRRTGIRLQREVVVWP